MDLPSLAFICNGAVHSFTTHESQMAPCLRHPPSADVMSTFRFGRCWTRGLHSVPVVAGQAPPALSNTGTQHLAVIPSCRQMSVHPVKQACPSVRPFAELL